MANWTTLGVGVLTAVAALGGSLGGHHLQARAEVAKHQREARRQNYETRRSAYIGLLAEIKKLLALADGAATSGSPMRAQREDAGPFLHALVEAELMAPSDVWAEMEPLARAVQVRVNYVSGSMRGSMQAEACEELYKLGDVDELLDRYVAAVRRDLRQ